MTLACENACKFELCMYVSKCSALYVSKCIQERCLAIAHDASGRAQLHITIQNLNCSMESHNGGVVEFAAGF